MKHLKKLLTQPLRAIPTSLAVVVLIVALLGFADAAYLTVEHYSGVIPPCSIGGCEQVLTSEYSTVLGIPVALGGVFFYLIVLVGVFAYVEGKREKLMRWALALTVFGFLGSLFFLYIQAFVLKAFCLYCLGSALTSTALFVLAIYIFSKYSEAR
jgi:uncharacterized membrane protein